jgi:hypothetical protein
VGFFRKHAVLRKPILKDSALFCRRARIDEIVMADPADLKAHRRRAALIMIVPALAMAAAAVFFCAAMPIAVLEQLSRLSRLAVIFPPPAPPLGIVARCLFGSLFALLLGSATWGFLFAIECRLGPARRRRRPVQVPIRPIRPAELHEAVRSAEARLQSGPMTEDPVPEDEAQTADPAPLELAEWQMHEAEPEPETVEFIELPVPAAIPQFSFADFRAKQAIPATPADKAEDEESVARLMTRLEEKIAVREPEDPHLVMHPEGPFRAQLEELKRLATRR